MKRFCLVFLPLLLVTAVGAYLRVGPALTLPMWFDEADTWRSAIGIDFARFLYWTHHFEHFPLGYLLSRLSCDLLAGGAAEPWALRLPALLAGVLCIPAGYLLGRVVAGPGVGLLAALLVAVDPNMVDQSIQCRMYTLWMLLILLALAWSIPLLRRPDRNMWHYTGLGAVLGLMLWTTPLTVLVWVGLAGGVALLIVAGWVLRRPHPQPWRVLSGFVMAFTIACLFAYIGVYRVLERFLQGGGDGTGMSVLQIAREVVVAAKDLISPHPVGLLAYVLAAVGLLLLLRRCKTSAAILLTLALVTLVMLFPFRRQHHFMDPRYLTTLQPTLWIGLAMAAAPSRWWLRGPAVLAVLVLAAGLGWQARHLERWQQQPDRYLFGPQIVRVRDAMAPGDAFFVVPSAADILSRYHHLEPDPRLVAAMVVQEQVGKTPRLDVPPDFDAPATWVVVGMINYPGRIAEARKVLDALARHYRVRLDEAALAAMLREQRVVTARFTAVGVTLHYAGLRGQSGEMPAGGPVPPAMVSPPVEVAPTTPSEPSTPETPL